MTHPYKPCRPTTLVGAISDRPLVSPNAHPTGTGNPSPTIRTPIGWLLDSPLPPRAPRYAPENKAIYTDLALMEVPSDPNVPNSFTVENGQMHLNATSWGKPDYTFVCKAK